MGNKASKAAEGIRSRMTIRRTQDNSNDEYPPEVIRLKYENMPTLTQEEKKVLKTSWKLISKTVHKECGAETFLRMFEQHPDTRSVFRKFQGLDLMALEQSMEIKEHGERVMQIVHKVIESIDNYQKIWDMLIGYGRMHFGYGALPMYFDLMGPHFVIAIRSCLGNDWYEALEYHWLALFNVIVYCMKFGWNLQRADEQKRAKIMSEKSKRNGGGSDKRNGSK